MNIWNYFTNIKARNAYKRILEIKGTSQREADDIMYKFGVYVTRMKGAFAATVLESYKDSSAFRQFLQDVFESKWVNNIKKNYKHIPQHFFYYVDFIELVEQQKQNDSDPIETVELAYRYVKRVPLRISKSGIIRRKVKLISTDNNCKILKPQDALEYIIETVGFERINEKHIEIRGYKLVQKRITSLNSNRYKDVGGYFVCKIGDRKEKLNIIRRINISFNLNFKIDEC